MTTEEKETLKKFLGEKVIYDPHGQMIFAVDKNTGHQIIGNFNISVRGWGAIQNKFKEPDGTINATGAEKFQDALGQFMTDAINEKLQGLLESKDKENKELMEKMQDIEADGVVFCGRCGHLKDGQI